MDTAKTGRHRPRTITTRTYPALANICPHQRKFHRWRFAHLDWYACWDCLATFSKPIPNPPGAYRGRRWDGA